MFRWDYGLLDMVYDIYEKIFGIQHSLTLFPMGGVESTPPNRYRSFRLFLPRKHVFLLLDFSYNGFRQPMVKKKLNFFGGTPRSGPFKISKLQNFQKVTPHDLL